MKLLILYSTTDGHTRKIAEFMAQKAQSLASINKAEAIDIKLCDTVNLTEYTHLIVGASIRYGKFAKVVYQFLSKNSEVINTLHSGFYSVNLTARKADKNTPETNVYTRKFMEQVSWKPNQVGVFAGALLYPRYGVLDKFMIKLIMKMTKGETDTSKEIDYTDWSAVGEYIQKFLVSS